MEFPTTCWSQLAQASLNGDTSARGALDRLCVQYHEPVRAFLRTRGYAEHDANDLTQEFFAELLHSRAWRRADQARGRFRTFLLGMLTHVVGRQQARAGAAKRGGGQINDPLEAALETAAGPVHEPAGSATFDREWAWRLMELAMAAVEREMAVAQHAAGWTVLVQFLPGAGEPPTYEEAAAKLALSLPAVKSAVHRVRRRFREELRQAVAQTVSTPHEIDEELAYLREVLSAHGP